MPSLKQINAEANTSYTHWSQVIYDLCHTRPRDVVGVLPRWYFEEDIFERIEAAIAKTQEVP